MFVCLFQGWYGYWGLHRFPNLPDGHVRIEFICFNCLLCSPGRIILIVENGRGLQIQGKGHLALVDKRTLGPANTGPFRFKVSLGLVQKLDLYYLDRPESWRGNQTLSINSFDGISFPLKQSAWKKSLETLTRWPNRW